MALAAKNLGEAAPSPHICGAGDWSHNEQGKGADKSAKGDPVSNLRVHPI